MPPPPFRFVSITRSDRQAVTQAVEAAIRGAGAWVTDFRQFSNAAVVFEVEVPAGRLTALHAALEATGLTVRPAREDLPAAPDAPEAGWPGTVRVEFVHGDPALRIPVPAVPG